MKKILLALFAATLLSACSDKKDDDTPAGDSPLIGTWIGVREEFWRIDSNGNLYDYQTGPYSEGIGMVFETENAGYFLENEGRPFPFTYVYYSDIQMIAVREADGDEYVEEVAKLTATELQLKGNDGDWVYLITYNKR